MTRYGFQPQFPQFVIREVKELNEGRIIKKVRSNVQDLRSVLWSSIDNADSLDLDQLGYCEGHPHQDITVKIAIADVDAFVPKGSQTDIYASNNGTSVYTGVEIFPMLPERLSTDLSSLKAGADRLAVVVEFTVLKNGDVSREKIYRALVRNKAKLIYEEIGDWLEGKGPRPQTLADIPGLEEQIRLQDEAAQRLLTFRTEKGALEFETIEPKPVMRDDVILDLIIQQKNQARYLIENFMIAANGAMVRFLEKRGSPMIQRIVRTPQNWLRIVDVATSLGEALPPEPDSRALSLFLSRQRRRDPEHFPDLSLTIVKLLGPGEYVMMEPGKAKYGHFGLAVMDYTHSTAPNRRYVDVIIQRLLKAVLDEKPIPYTKRELIEHASWCTDRDKAAKKVERFMRKVEAAILLREHVGKSFDAIVTGASDKGTYVRLLAPPVEGRVVRGEEGMTVGQKVRVRLVYLNEYKGFVDFAREGVPRSTPRLNQKERHMEKYYRRQAGRRRRRY